MGEGMKRILGPALALSIGLLPTLTWAWGAGRPTGQTKEEEEAFTSASAMFADAGRDKMAVVQAFESYVEKFPGSQRVSDAEFMIGEAYMQQALSILKAEASDKRNSSARLLAPKNPAAAKALDDARKAFEQVAGDKK